MLQYIQEARGEIKLHITVKTERLGQNAESLLKLAGRIEELSQTLFSSGSRLADNTPVQREAEILKRLSRSLVRRSDELSALSQVLSAVSEEYELTERSLAYGGVSGLGAAGTLGTYGADGSVFPEQFIRPEVIRSAVIKTIFPLLDGVEEGGIR